MAPPDSRKRPQILLASGAALGLLLAAWGLLAGGEPTGVPDGAVASVNGRLVRFDSYTRAVAALASDRRSPVGEAEKRHVLDRLIEEELLVQRGLELGLANSDRRVRANLVSTVIQNVVADASLVEPEDADVERFYRENADYFTGPGRLRVRQVFVRLRGREREEVLARANEAVTRLRSGEAFADVRAALGDEEVAPVPDDRLPPAKIREYLGPTALREAMELEVGGVSDPVRSASGLHVLQLVEREPAWTPPLAEIGNQVGAEMRRRAGDQALRNYLDELRERADVRVVDPIP